MYLLLLSLIGLRILISTFLKIEGTLFEKILYFTISAIFVSAVILKIINLGKYLPLNGELDGYLIFKNDLVQIGDESFELDKIRSIKISNEDYIGRLFGSQKGNFGPALSNGTENFLSLIFMDNSTKKYQFELVRSDDFQKVRKTLIIYYIEGKMSYHELINVLGEKSESDQRQLEFEIENISTAANRR
ncbi:hypothetical protein [Flavobacterium selenitireducens]|uniref:hypothetical protein n=1 Tax=Flavobacterium selenitireducens TaxID=2722704 RepID=UPI00168BF734|nr:hypothetical protein [Flavobacterium selenitireducens]MBD3584016.1 hypothetical protein [Flavobacterium selenitireducens]